LLSSGKAHIKIALMRNWGDDMAGVSYTIRPMNRTELGIAIDWAAAEGWNPGLGDRDCFFDADPSGFLMGFLGEKPIASISAVKYGNSFGFVGFYIVAPEHRGQGYGIQIWNAALKNLEGRTVGLDGEIGRASCRERGATWVWVVQGYTA